MGGDSYSMLSHLASTASNQPWILVATGLYVQVCCQSRLVVLQYSNFFVGKTEAQGQCTCHKRERKISGILGMSIKFCACVCIHVKLGALFGAEVHQLIIILC